jgi:hypothetical protein
MSINSILKYLFSVLLIAGISISCSKEKEEFPVYEYNAPHYDLGHLCVKVIANPGVVTKVEYKNLTKGSTSLIDVGGFSYNQSTNTSILSVPLANGNFGDNVQCCITLTSNANVGVEFINIPTDSITTSFATAGIECKTGNF